MRVITEGIFLPQDVRNGCLSHVIGRDPKLGGLALTTKSAWAFRWIGLVVLIWLIFHLGVNSRADLFELESVELSPLRSADGVIRAHTQGLEMAGGFIWVTARRDLPEPRSPLLLRTSFGAKGWDIWDLGSAESKALDHPGGFQSDGKRFWIPFAESRRQGRTLIRAYAWGNFRPGERPIPEFEFAVEDHIGALAIESQSTKLFGAAWDTDTVYVWDFNGRQIQKLRGSDLRRRGLGAALKVDGTPGLAVQDWKFVNGALVASGLIKSTSPTALDVQSRLLWFDPNLEPKPSLPPLPTSGSEVPLAREGMAVADGFIYFLPGDLGATNHLYRMPWAPFHAAACDCY